MADDLTAVFQALRPLYSAHAARCVVTADEPGRYYLSVHKVREKDGYRMSVGGVEIKKAYVSAHLMPVYVHPEMLGGLSPALRKRMQGKSCFNFRTPDPGLFEELGQLVDAGIDRFAADGWL
ncbi:hypothetical protein RDV64_10405 [Acuticoccus sp. MNP-M23]|uniref:hypothetical protein n=1 Tax=Acuticoccus sp. MNP-M23 TaxID=3072793 RepID=UPI0028161CEA|nr:hypothetical protein [Acuticoccus sp. MNP-M23]WMS44758.1 hypothetical protein RDV64_10405 [Acuticoccus sp. MNP-M23]